MLALRRRAVAGLSMVTAVVMTTVGVAAGPAAAEAAVPGSWPQMEGNPAHTGDEPGEKSLNVGNVGQLSVAWTAPLPQMPTANDVVVTGGVVYTSDGRAVTALNALTGAQLWQVTFPNLVSGAPSVGDGMVLVGLDRRSPKRSYITALNATTGATVWTRPIPIGASGSSTVSGPITITASQAFFIAGGDQVEAINLRNGYKHWISPLLQGCSLSPPTVAGGYVLVGGGGGFVSALHSSNGTLAWQDSLNGECGESEENWLPAVSQGTVYAGLMDGVYAISLSSGAVQWKVPSSSGGVFFPVTVTNQYVLASVDNTTQLVALNRSTGAQVWQTSFPHSVVIESTYVFGGLAWFFMAVGTRDMRMDAVNLTTGHRVFNSALYIDLAQGFPPVVDAGDVYMSTGRQVICYALPASS